MKVKFEWRILTDDGLLKKPEGAGPYYNRDESIRNQFDSEDDAISVYQEFENEHPYYAEYQMVLIKLHQVSR